MVSLRCKKAWCVFYSSILFASGILLIVLPSILLYKVFRHFDFIPGSTVGPLIVLIILGILHLLLSWLGVKGPTREHNFHIMMFLFFTFMLLFAELTIGVWSMVLWDEVGVPSTDLLTQAFNEMIKEKIYNKQWAKVQTDIQCCGLLGVNDYFSHPHSQEEEEATKLWYPSCKNTEVPSVGGEIVPYDEGCGDAFVKFVELILLGAALMGFFSAIFQGLGLFIVFSFYRTLRAERHKRSAARAELQRQLSGQSQPSQALIPPPINGTPLNSAPPSASGAPETQASAPPVNDSISAPPPPYTPSDNKA